MMTPAVELKSSTSPASRLVAIICFTTLWCGVVSVFVYDVIKGWRSGDPNWFLTIFITPFVLIGIGGMVLIVHQALALRNPRVKLLVEKAAVPLGGELKVSWQLSGRTHLLRHLQIFVEGREEAIYRQGTSTYTDTLVFAELPIIDTGNPAEMPEGSGKVTIPLIHSFKSPNNRIIWAVRVIGQIPLWPNVIEEFEYPVLPYESH